MIIRNKNDPHIFECISSLVIVARGVFELIIIDSSENPLDRNNLPFGSLYIYENVTRFEALSLGVAMARFESILIIDSDQIVSPDLISELSNIREDMCIIRELSYNRNFVGRISDQHREFLFKHSKNHVSKSLPVVPRMYRKDVLEKAMAQLQAGELSLINQHEDSVIYSEVLKLTHSVGFCNIPIFNIDPSFHDFAIKSFKYGVSQATALSSKGISKEKADLLRSLDMNRVIYSDTEGFNTGILYDILKASFYVPGFFFGKIHKMYT